MTRDEIIGQLRPMEGELRAKGITALYLFGSFVRGEAGAASDIDLACSIDDNARMGLFEFVGVQMHLQDRMKRKVDLVPLRSMRPYVRRDAEPQMIKIF
jgi:uncharacterized protein